MKIDQLTAWKKLVRDLWDLVEKDPRYAPILQGLSIEYANKKDKEIFKLPNRLFYIFYNFIKKLFYKKKERLPKEKNDKYEVVLVTHVNRKNYLTICSTIADALWDRAASVNVALVYPHRQIENIHAENNKKIKYEQYNIKYTLSLRLLFDAIRIVRIVKKRLIDDQNISIWMKRSFISHVLQVVCYLATIEYYRHWLREKGCRILIPLNEQWTPCSVLVAAAKLEGIKTCQVLHGFPNQRYYPFTCDETWMWGKSTQATFIHFGAQEESLPLIGALEFNNIAVKQLSVIKNNKPKIGTIEPQHCVFFSQLHGDEFWGTSAYSKAIKWLGKALNESVLQWRLTIRLHPADDVDNTIIRFQELLSLPKNVDLSFSLGEISLDEELVSADFACTASSSAIISALLLRVPCALIWTAGLDYIHGPPFLNESFVAGNPKKLTEIMEKPLSPEQFDEEIYYVLGDAKKAGERAAKRILNFM